MRRNQNLNRARVKAWLTRPPSTWGLSLVMTDAILDGASAARTLDNAAQNCGYHPDEGPALILFGQELRSAASRAWTALDDALRRHLSGDARSTYMRRRK